MNLRDLQYLTAAADQLHFGKAAVLCNVSQPTLSMQLKKLEEYLGAQLFERTNKSVMLTPIGREIAERARHILTEAEQIRALSKAAKDPLAGEIKMGLFPTLAPYLLPSLAPALKDSFSKLELVLVEEKTPELVRQLTQGEIDCALLSMPIGQDGFSSIELFVEPFLLAVSHTHPLAGRKRISLEDIAGETVLLLEDGHCLREQALEVCQSIGIGETRNFRATSMETLRHMVAAGKNVTLIPKLAAQQNDAALCYIPFKNPAPSRLIGIYWRATSARSALFAQMAKLMKEQYRHI